MKFIILVLASTFYLSSITAQPSVKKRNIFIITIDGYRWQELFGGADSALINDQEYVKDRALNCYLYWDSTVALRRKKLMPFFWNVIAAQGQLYGNRLLRNKVNVKNWYKISYPGYNEMLTGYPDPLFIPNIPLNNRNTSVLEYLNTKEAYADKVIAFTSWNIFPFILNERRSRLPLNSGYNPSQHQEKDSINFLIDAVQQNVVHKRNTRYDQLTYLNAAQYIGEHHPKIVFLGFGETDECAHAGRYDLYLQKANNIDRMISELWYYVQTDPFYKNNTTFIITTDHGRGSKQSSWFTHGIFTKGSADTWLALLGPDIAPAGEMQSEGQIYQKQLAATIAMLIGEKFETNYLIGKPIVLPVVPAVAVNNQKAEVAPK